MSEVFESFLAGELWAEVLKDDSMLDLASHDFGVMQELTTTRPGALGLCQAVYVA